MADLQSIIKNSFTQYAGAVLQSRALVDVRDCLKPSARQIFFSMLERKLVSSKPYKKTANAVGMAMADYYIHGDSSAEGIIMRSGQSFAMRYPITDIKGNSGSLIEPGNWAASRYCLTGEAFVSTDKGLIKIEDIVKSEKNSDNEIPTLTCRGAFGLTTTNLIFNSGLQQTYKLTLKNGIQISGTPNHPILTLNDKFEFIWKTIDELDVGDKILLNVRNNFLYGKEDDIEYAKALGCLVSEGYLGVENKIYIINSDLDMIMPVQNLLQKYGSKATYHRRKQKDNCYEIGTNNQALYKRLKEDNCTYNSYDKHIPNSVFRGTREYQKEFIKYLFEGDGCISIHSNRYGTIAYSSVSEDLIRELQILLLSNFGIVSFISRQKNRKEIKLTLGGEDAYLFCKDIGFVSERKNKKAEQTIKFYEENRNKKSTGSRGWRVFPEIREYLMHYHPEAKLIVSRKDRPNECKGPLMSKDGLKILKEKLPYEAYNKIEFVYRNFVSIPIIQKEDNGFQVVYSPKINEGCNSFTANGIINHNTESRLGKIADLLFEDLDKETITEWRDNYDNTKQYPSVLPSKGFYNIVNGTMGIGVGAASSIPSFNLKEVNEALIKVLWNPSIGDDEIICLPDFATGAYLLNEEEVKESLKNGVGKACKLRAKIEFDSNDRCLIVTEIPYSVYTNTICGELETILESEDNPGIDRFNDLTGSTPLIKIYLTKKANIDKVLRYLYKNTSLQYHYGINMTMLEDGRYPKVFTWKQALIEHVNHELTVYYRGFEFDLNKIKDRLHIVEGILIALASIESVIETIKNSSSTKEANQNLCKNFLLDEIQAKAILDMKLARLAKLETKKYIEEKEKLLKEKEHIEEILDNEFLLKKEVEKGLKEVAEKFGDTRRTQILNIENEDDEPIEVKNLLINITNQNNIFVSENSSLMIQRRGGVGSKFKLNKGEYVISTSTAETTDLILFFTNKGNFYHYVAGALPIDEKLPIESLIPIKSWETVTAISSFNKKNSKEYIIFFTKNGIMKKSKLSEYNMKRNSGLKALELEDNDEVVSVLFINDERVGMLTAAGQFIICETKDIRPIGRVAKGVKGIKLNLNDELVAAYIYSFNTKYIVSISKDGYIKQTAASEFNVQGRGTKGAKLQKLKDNNDSIIGFLPIIDEKEIIVTSTSAQIKININSIPILSKGAQGNKSIKLKDKDSVIGISKF